MTHSSPRALKHQICNCSSHSSVTHMTSRWLSAIRLLLPRPVFLPSSLAFPSRPPAASVRHRNLHSWTPRNLGVRSAIYSLDQSSPIPDTFPPKSFPPVAFTCFFSLFIQSYFFQSRMSFLFTAFIILLPEWTRVLWCSGGAKNLILFYLIL